MGYDYGCARKAWGGVMRETKKILILCTRPLIPDKDGKTLTMSQYCAVLKNDYGCQIYFACFDLKEEQPDYIERSIALKRPSSIEFIYNLLVKTFFRRKFPIQTSMMYSRHSIRLFKKEIDRIKPDIVVCDMIRLVPYIDTKDTPYIKILDMDELISKRYRKQIESGFLDGNVLGQYKDKVPSIFIRTVEKLKIMRSLLKMEERLVEREENNTPLVFDKVFFCSPQDMNEYVKRTGREASCIHVSMNEKYMSEPRVETYQKNRIGFIGNMDAAPNKTSMEYMLNEIMPRIRKIDDTFKLLVIGKCSKDSYETYKEFGDITEFTFYVENMKEYAEKCLAIVVPVIYGSGIKTKVIQALSMGVPVITNEIGAEGLSAKQEELVICENPDDFAAEIKKMYENPDYRNTVARNGREYVGLNHSASLLKNEVGSTFLGV